MSMTSINTTVKNLRVLKGISTKFYEGDVVCIIGPSVQVIDLPAISLRLLEEVTKGQITVNGYNLIVKNQC